MSHGSRRSSRNAWQYFHRDFLPTNARCIQDVTLETGWDPELFPSVDRGGIRAEGEGGEPGNKQWRRARAASLPRTEDLSSISRYSLSLTLASQVLRPRHEAGEGRSYYLIERTRI